MQKIFTAQTGSLFLNSEYQLIINRNELIFEKKLEVRGENLVKLELEIIENEILIPEDIQTEILEFGNCHWKIDENKIKLPLKLRKKQEGDVFFPIGMIGKKKVSKFFKDEKISILAKQKIWLLCDANEQIVGVLPFRQDGRFATEVLGKNIIAIDIKKNNHIGT